MLSSCKSIMCFCYCCTFWFVCFYTIALIDCAHLWGFKGSLSRIEGASSRGFNLWLKGKKNADAFVNFVSVFFFFFLLFLLFFSLPTLENAVSNKFLWFALVALTARLLNCLNWCSYPHCYCLLLLLLLWWGISVISYHRTPLMTFTIHFYNSSAKCIYVGILSTGVFYWVCGSAFMWLEFKRASGEFIRVFRWFLNI